MIIIKTVLEMLFFIWLCFNCHCSYDVALNLLFGLLLSVLFSINLFIQFFRCVCIVAIHYFIILLLFFIMNSVPYFAFGFRIKRSLFLSYSFFSSFFFMFSVIVLFLFLYFCSCRFYGICFRMSFWRLW